MYNLYKVAGYKKNCVVGVIFGIITQILYTILAIPFIYKISGRHKHEECLEHSLKFIFTNTWYIILTS